MKKTLRFYASHKNKVSIIIWQPTVALKRQNELKQKAANNENELKLVS